MLMLLATLALALDPPTPEPPPAPGDCPEVHLLAGAPLTEEEAAALDALYTRTPAPVARCSGSLDGRERERWGSGRVVYGDRAWGEVELREAHQRTEASRRRRTLLVGLAVGVGAGLLGGGYLGLRLGLAVR